MKVEMGLMCKETTVTYSKAPLWHFPIAV